MKPFIVKFPVEYAIAQIEINAAGVLTIYLNPKFHPEVSTTMRFLKISQLLMQCFKLTGTQLFDPTRKEYDWLHDQTFEHTALKVHTHAPEMQPQSHYHLYSGGSTTPAELECFLHLLIKIQDDATLREKIFNTSPAVLYYRTGYITQATLNPGKKYSDSEQRAIKVWTGKEKPNTTIPFLNESATTETVEEFSAFLSTHNNAIATEKRTIAELFKQHACEQDFFCANEKTIRFISEKLLFAFYSTSFSFMTEILTHLLIHTGLSEKKSRALISLAIAAFSLYLSFSWMALTTFSVLVASTNQTSSAISNAMFF